MELEEGHTVKVRLSSSQLVLVGAGIVLTSAAIGEHLFRRVVERRYRDAVASRQQLEQRYAEALATHEQLQEAVAAERRRSDALEQALAERRAELEDTIGRLTEEAQTIRELQMRLAAMQSRMDQLQGELALALQPAAAGAASAEGGAVQLERIIVGDAQTAGQQGRVVSVYPQWKFVIVDFGWDAVRIGDTVSIFRDEQLVAKARVERVQEGVSAATILSDWEPMEIRVNDVARLL